MPSCGACGLEFTDEELSAYLDRVLCRACYPKTPTLKALRGTSEHSPYMAFALSMLVPGGGHVYAGSVGQGYVLNAVVNGAVIAGALGSILISPTAFAAVIIGVAVLLPVVAVLIGGHAVRQSQVVRRGERPQPPSLRPLWIFLGVGAATLGVDAVVLLGCMIYLARQPGAIFG